MKLFMGRKYGLSVEFYIQLRRSLGRTFISRISSSDKDHSIITAPTSHVKKTPKSSYNGMNAKCRSKKTQSAITKHKSETRIKLRTSISKFTLCHINRVLFQTHKQTHALCRALTWWLMKTSDTKLTFTVPRVSNMNWMKGDFGWRDAKINLLVRDEPNFWRPLTIHT